MSIYLFLSFEFTVVLFDLRTLSLASIYKKAALYKKAGGDIKLIIMRNFATIACNF